MNDVADWAFSAISFVFDFHFVFTYVVGVFASSFRPFWLRLLHKFHKALALLLVNFHLRSSNEIKPFNNCVIASY